ncbi:Hsp20/alpha crystallin family protein [bacterium]|nr:Hsp20/alpha crystallin family protein [bacterium]
MYTDLYKPYRQKGSIINEMENLLQKHFGGFINTGPLAGEWLLPENIEETKDSLIVTVDLPGLSPENIDLIITGDTLTIRGERKENSGQVAFQHLLGEKYYGSFHRSIKLPISVQSDKIDAMFYNERLKIVLPKMEEGASSKKIEIKSI